jgi:hypothetical protein
MTRKQTYLLFAYYLFHILLVYAMRKFGVIGQFHALLLVGAGLTYAIRGKIVRLTYVLAYIVCAEALWRATQTSVVYEFGKYAVSFLMIITFFIRGVRGALMPMLYLLILIPGAVMTTTQVSDFEVFRRVVSFNFSGPFSLAICVLFFLQHPLPKEKIHTMFLIAVGPICGIAFNALFKTYYNIMEGEVKFTQASNFITSGGGGPNQISAMLGLGVLLIFFYLIENRKARFRWLFVLMMLWFAAQSALTFSRTGLYLVACSIIPASLFLIQNTRVRNRVIGIGIIFFVLGNFVILPKLSKFTGGAIEKRFQSKEVTGRDILIADDIRIWKENWFWGVGVGRAAEHHSFRAVAHTEYTRLLAEHGIFGIGAMMLLMGMALQFLARAKTNVQRGIVVGMVMWTFFFMSTSAMRLVAPSFIFGLAGVRIIMPTPVALPPRRKAGLTFPGIPDPAGPPPGLQKS